MIEPRIAPEKRAADELQREVLKRLEGKRPLDIAVIAQLQSVMVNAALQAVLEMLVHKNVFSERELQAALKHHYEKATDRLEIKDNGQIVVPSPAPLVRPT